MIPGVTIIAIGGTAAGLLPIAALVGVVRTFTRPANEQDAYFDRLDLELDAEERAARAQLRVVRQAREDQIHGLPAARATVTDEGVLLDFPRRFRLIAGGLDAMGDDADTVFPELIDAGGMLRGDGLGGRAA